MTAEAFGASTTQPLARAVQYCPVWCTSPHGPTFGPVESDLVEDLSVRHRSVVATGLDLTQSSSYEQGVEALVGLECIEWGNGDVEDYGCPIFIGEADYEIRLSKRDARRLGAALLMAAALLDEAEVQS